MEIKDGKTITDWKGIDLIGYKFDYVTVIDYPTKERNPKWQCICDCGNTTAFRKSKIMDHSPHHPLSCGCKRVHNSTYAGRKKNSPILTGKKFNRLTVIGDSGKRGGGDSGNILWDCVCECGNTTSVPNAALVSGKTKSCGCYAAEQTKERATTHGLSKTIEYKIWCKMRHRCYSPRSENDKKNYFDRGITVSQDWLDSFENFLRDMGKRPSPKYSIDRLDNNKGYSKENCAWRTATEQSRNRRSNVYYTYKGETLMQCDWALKFGVHKSSLRTLVNKRGVEVALSHYEQVYLSKLNNTEYIPKWD